MTADRAHMRTVAEVVIARQDDGDVGGIVELFSDDCVFAMPVLGEPLRGRDELRAFVESWPKAETAIERLTVEGDRLTCAWNWRGEGFPDDTPLLRGVSTFVFDADGLITEYEDWFDPDWATRPAQLA